MKKGLLSLLMIIGVMLSSQNVLQQFTYFDGLRFENPLLMPDGKTPVYDGCLIEICLPVYPNEKSYFEDYHGEDLHNNLVIDHMNGGQYEELGEGFFLTSKYFIWVSRADTTKSLVVRCGNQIYLRMYNASTIEESTHYRTSRFIVGPLEGSMPSELEIETWYDWQEIPEKPEEKNEDDE